jgi:cell division protein FtsI/penicillin-binding protein 2
LAQVFSVFANDGYLPPIHLVKGEELGDAHAVLQTETVDLVNVMLQDVVQHGTGTQAQVPGLTIYGKTGTAETVGGHTQLPTGEKIAFALLVEEGGVGGQTAAPLVRNYLSRLF